MILPEAVDLEIAARHTFALEAGFLQHARGGIVVRQACRLQPVQPERDEGERQHGLDGVRHVAATDVGRADPVADRGGLRDATPDVADAETSQQHRVGLSKNEQGVAQVLFQLALVLAQAPAEGRARQLIARPLRLPHGQVQPAHGPELGPGLVVGHGRMAQQHVLAENLGLAIARRR